jgi:F0F1-type ATP synthase assembly protein I
MARAKDLKRQTSYATVGLEFVVSIIFGFLGGRWLDGKLGTHPWLALTGLVFGLVAGFRFIYRAAKRMNADAGGDSDFKESSVGRDARFTLDQKDERDD